MTQPAKLVVATEKDKIIRRQLYSSQIIFKIVWYITEYYEEPQHSAW